MTLFGQSDNFHYGPCCDTNGVVNDTTWIISSPYSVRRFKRKYNVKLNIEEYQISGQSYATKVHYAGKIKSSTPLLEISSKYAIKLTLGKAIENKNKLLLLKIDFYIKDSDCWKLQTLNHGYSIINFNPQAFGFISFSTPEGSFFIKKGALEIM